MSCPKAVIFGIEINKKFKAYPIVELKKSRSSFTNMIASIKIKVQFNKNNNTIRVQIADNGREIVLFYGFWFSWMAIHPKSEVYQAQKKNK